VGRFFLTSERKKGWRFPSFSSFFRIDLLCSQHTSPGSILDAIAKENNVTPGAVALAWLLKRSPVTLPIPGTSKVKHLEENGAAVTVTLSDEEFQMLNAQGRAQMTGQSG
jgi:aryl-alcohol dehydrogenase-like predicted oxidoreductase